MCSPFLSLFFFLEHKQESVITVNLFEIKEKIQVYSRTEEHSHESWNHILVSDELQI